jgi:hypothetical protein
MKKLRVAIVALVVPVLVFSVFVATVVLAAPSDKASICHFANHKYVAITVSGNALPAHLAHGDVMPDAYGDCP